MLFGPGQPPSAHRHEHGDEAAQVVLVPLVEREHALVHVAPQMLRVDADIGAVQAALDSAQKFSMPFV